MKPTRSMLFVPGHKQSWAKKAVAAGADAVILDLEDSVPEDMKAETRHMVAETIGELAKRASVSTSLLRYYEKEALLKPAGRTPSTRTCRSATRRCRRRRLVLLLSRPTSPRNYRASTWPRSCGKLGRSSGFLELGASTAWCAN